MALLIKNEQIQPNYNLFSKWRMLYKCAVFGYNNAASDSVSC